MAGRMKIVGRDEVEEFLARHADALSAFDAWYAEVEHAEWKTFVETRAQFPSASYVNKHVIFNLRHNRYRLDTIIAYKNQVVFINRIGTHADYDKWEF